MASPSPNPMIKFNYTLADYQEKFQTRENGVYPTPCASNLSGVLLSDLVEDIISSLSGKKVEFERAELSPTKARGSGSVIDHKLDDTQTEQLEFITKCLRRWLPHKGQCFGVSLPCTDDIVSYVNQSLYGTSYDSDEDETVPAKKKCNLGVHFTGALHELLQHLRGKMQAENTFSIYGQGKELVVAIGNLVTICDRRAECCLSTVKGRTTVTANVQWDDGTTGEFISIGDSEILIDDLTEFAFEIKKDNCVSEAPLAAHLMLRAALQHTPVMGIIVSGSKHRLLKVDESHNTFTVKELDTFDLSDRSSMIEFVHMLFHILRGTTVDGGALTSVGQDVEPTSSN